MNYKFCSSCKKSLPETLEYFALKKLKTKTSFQSFCKTCQKKYRKKHYENNKSYYIDKSKKYRDALYSWFIKIKKDLACEICGENRWWVLDFHHSDPSNKKMEVSILARSSSKKIVLEEISKCRVLCSNCHRDLHYKEKYLSIS